MTFATRSPAYLSVKIDANIKLVRPEIVDHGFPEPFALPEFEKTQKARQAAEQGHDT